MQKENHKKTHGYPYLKKTLVFFKGQGLKFLGIFICVLVYIGIAILTPLIEGKIVANISNLDQTKTTIIQILIYAGLGLITAIDYYIWNLLFFRLRRDVCIHIVNVQMKCAMDVKNKVYDEVGSGKFINRIIWDSENLAGLYSTIIEAIGDMLVGVGVFIYTFFINYWIGIYLFGTLAIILVVDALRIKRMYRLHRIAKDKEDLATSMYNESIMANKDIKALNIDKPTLKIAHDRFANHQNFVRKKEFENNWLRLFRDLLSDLSYIGFFLLNAYFLQWGLLVVESFFILYLYRERVFGSLQFVIYIKEELNNGEVAARRVYSLVEDKDYPHEKFGSVQLNEVKGEIVFDKVTFGYKPDTPVLKNLSFKIDAGSTIGIVGRSGNGKSTILSLIDKMYDIDGGSIKLDGVDIRDLSEQSLRGNITYVSQFPYMFDYSIIENLRWVKPNATKKEIVEACKRAQIHDYIMTLPKKYNTVIGENASTISGGQKQRIAIARAFLNNTKIILFDEATSSLDNESQERVKQAIAEMGKDHTVVIVAHRLTTVEDCDSIMMVDKGKVIARGTHKELYKTCAPYRELYREELKRSDGLSENDND